ncbi:MAG: GNAT family N-acetyltransferase [Candidatus Latescibacteria bacterium]|nr:GNAT family N-acetyltransferase [Candidatus Latescibacterota bacterium]
MTDAAGSQVRPATTDDVRAVVELSRLWAEEGCTIGYVALMEGGKHLRSWLDGGYFFVCEHEGVVIAYAAGVVKVGKYAIFEPEGERYLDVHEVFVHIDHREKGAGDRLIEALLSRSESEGISRSMVGSNNVDWLRTYRFYERRGYGMFSIQMYK